MKNSRIKKQINRRHAKAVRQIKKYWTTQYKKAVLQYEAAHAAYVALYNDMELIDDIAGENHINQYGLEIARAEAAKAEDGAFVRAEEALRRYLCA